MPYEDDYKMWLEKSLIEMNPDWICDGMADKEFTHKWCEENCGKDNAYIMPKCLHMYYHHIVRTDCETEPNSSEKPNNSKDEPQIGEMMTEEEFDSMLARVLIGKDEPQTDCPQANICSKPCKECGACETECGLWRKIKDEPQTDCAWGKDE